MTPLPRRIGPRTLMKLSPRQRDTHDRALRAVRLMRDDDMPLRQAARAEGISPATVRRYVPASLEKRGGRWHARKGTRDRTPREIETISAGQCIGLITTSLSQASKLARYKQAVNYFLDEGDDIPLGEFEGAVVAGYELETDTDELQRIADAGLLDDWRIYTTRGASW